MLREGGGCENGQNRCIPVTSTAPLDISSILQLSHVIILMLGPIQQMGASRFQGRAVECNDRLDEGY